VFAGATILRYAAFAASWSVIGSAILAGGGGALTTWALLLVATIPLGALAEAAEGRTAVALGARLRERTLRGALALDPSWVRREGPGHILGRAMEVDAVARLAAGGGLSAVTAVIELCVGGVALALSASGRAAAGVLAIVLVAAGAVAAVAVRRRRAWAAARLAQTDELLEAIAGQRTRLIQGDHDASRRARQLEHYIRLGAAADRPLAALAGALPPLAFAVGIGAIALAGDLSSSADTALALGGVLLVGQALRRIAAAVETLASASIARRALAPILSAAARPPSATQGRAQAPRDGGGPRVAPTEAARPGAAAAASLEVRDLRVERGGREVLREVELELRAGDRAVLSGASGSGKSTLAAAIAGLLPAAHGTVELGNARPQDPGWRTRVGFVPQHGDNHVLLAPMAFNLLMGRAWPPRERDLEDAAAVCRELGLGPLLERMPAGIGQVVGETGWRLSQGERARLCLARALLADHDVLILDEPLGALDPHTARTILDVVQRRARTLVVISQE
jgi:ATP-binding cassette subfamily B protein